MEEIINEVVDFFRKDDWLESVFLYIGEHYELIVTIVAVLFIFVLSLSAILERLQKKGWVALVPIYRFVVIFKAIGISPACVLLMLIPGVNLIMRVIFYVKLARKFNRNYGFVPFLVLLPLIFLPIVAFGDGKYIYIDRAKLKSEKKKQEIAEKSALRAKAAAKKQRVKAPSVAEIQAEDDFESELAEVLSIAEVRENRAQARVEKAEARMRETISSQRAESMPRKPVQTKDMMPTMKQGPMSQQARIRRDNVESEYERLLRQQEEAQRRRMQRQRQTATPTSPAVKRPVANRPVAARSVAAKRPTMDIRVRKPVQKPQPAKPTARKIKIDF